MFRFIKKHLFLCCFCCFGLFFASLFIVTTVLKIENKTIIALCLLPLVPGVIFALLGLAKESDEADARHAARRTAQTPARKPELSPGERDDAADSAHSFSALCERDMKKAALRVGDNKPDFAAILKIDGWRVDTMSAYLILFPELFEKKLIETFEVLPIFEPTPEICLYDDGTIAARFRLDGEPGDDFTGKYFHMCARIYMQGKPAAPAVLMDGFISDDANPDETIRLSHIGYRMEVRFVGGEIARLRTYAQRGMDVEQKALRFPGVITPGNIRYLGICAECARSFMFHSYNFPHMNEIPAYSDDGLDVCGVPVSIPDAQNWEGTIGGIRFSTHNAFRCPHCGAPYVDYQSHPEMMRYGTYACVHGGRKITEFQPDPLPDA